jgi:hypothetical protein
MPEMSEACHHHGQSTFFAVRNGVFVSDGTSWLDEGLDAFSMAHFYAVIKRKEGITGQDGTLQLKIELLCFFNGMPEGIYAGGLSATFANQLFVFGDGNGI